MSHVSNSCNYSNRQCERGGRKLANPVRRGFREIEEGSSDGNSKGELATYQLQLTTTGGGPDLHNYISLVTMCLNGKTTLEGI